MRYRRVAYVLALLPSLALTAPSCSDDDPKGGGAGSGGNEGAIGKVFEKEIGPGGGTLAAENMSLYVPRGAVDKPTRFKISVKAASGYPSSGELLGPVYEIEPHGLAFGDRGVMLSMPVSKRPPAGEVAVLATLDPATNAWTPLEGSIELGTGATASVNGRTTHFSAFTTFHAPYKFDERCREPLTAGGLGIQQPDTFNAQGATLIERQKNYNGTIEYGSYWRVNQPTVTFSGVGMIDGNGQWGAWELYEPTSGRPKPVPTGFPISGKKFSFSVNFADLVSRNKVALSVDDFCPPNIDVGWECATPDCAGTVTPGGPTDGGADADSGPVGPVACQVGGLNPLTNAPRALAADGLNPLLFGATDQASTGAVSVFNLANPTAPVLTDTLDLTVATTREVDVGGLTGYVTDDRRVVLVSMQNPSNLVEIGSFNFDTDPVLRPALVAANGNSIPNGIRPSGIALFGTHLYASTSDLGFVALNVTNPSAITLAGYLTTGNVGPRNVVVSGNRAYSTAHESRFCSPGPCPPDLRGFQIFDIANPTAMAKLGEVHIPGSTPRSIAVTGSTVYVFSTSNNTIYPVDVSNPASPTVGTGVVTKSTFPQRGVVVGTKLFVAVSTSDAHVEVYDISTPMAPQFLADETINGSGGAYAIAKNGMHVYAGGIGHLKALDGRCP